MRRTAVPLLVTLALLAPRAADALGLEGWGLRAGTYSSPGALAVGAELDLGYLVEPVRLVPALELGLRRDTSVLSLSLPLLYTWGDPGEVRLYAGAGALLTALDLESRHDDREDFEVAPFVTFGLELGGTLESLYFEGSVSTGDTYERKLVVGWRY